MARLAIVALALLATSAARAQGDDAARLVLDGLDKMKAGEPSEALSSFGRAYALSRDPRILGYAAEAYAGLGNCAAARTMQRTFEKLEPNAPAPAEDGALGRCLAPKAEPEPEPEPAPEPAPRPTPIAPRAPVEEETSFSIPGLITIMGGVALGVGGVYFGLQAQQASDDVDALYDGGGQWNAEAQELERKGQRDEKLAMVFLGAGGAAIVTGTILLLVHRPKEKHVSALPLPGGGALVWTCDF